MLPRITGAHALRVTAPRPRCALRTLIGILAASQLLMAVAAMGVRSKDTSTAPAKDDTTQLSAGGEHTREKLGAVTLSNTKLPRDSLGNPLITGETSVLAVNDSLYFYVNNWGGCPSVDCCRSSGGCASCCFLPPSTAYPDACVFTTNHSVLVYHTTDLNNWSLLGVALSTQNRPRGIEFRPHVVYNSARQLFVMWYEDRPPPSQGHPFGSAGYNVAVSRNAEGPFRTIATRVKVADVPGDFDILVDDNLTAWHVQTTTNDPEAVRGFVVTKLDTDYAGPASPRISASFVAPKPAEGPVMFQRRGLFYILGGTTCCACKGGSSIFVFQASSPLGPWKYVDDVGSNPGKFNPHNPHSYVTGAQASTVFEFPAGSGQLIWLGNQWVSSPFRNTDLLYWSILSFNSTGHVQQFTWMPNCTVNLSNLRK